MWKILLKNYLLIIAQKLLFININTVIDHYGIHSIYIFHYKQIRNTIFLSKLYTNKYNICHSKIINSFA